MRKTIVMDWRLVAISKSQKTFLTIQISKQRNLLLAYSLFVLFALFEPDYIAAEIAPLHLVFRFAKYVSAFLVILFFLIRRIKLNSLLLEILLFEGALLLSTLINNGSAIGQWISNCGYVIVLMLLAQTVMEIDAQIFPLALSIVLGLLTHINSICRLLYPSGMYISSAGYRSCWFLGYDNVASMIILLALTVAIFRIFYYKNRLLLWDWSILMGGCWFLLVQKVATGLVGVVIFFIFVLASKSQWFRKRFSKGKLVVVGMVFLFFLIQFVGIQMNSIFSFIFEILQKSTTFTGRTRIWALAWGEIQNGGWLLGKGVLTTETYQNHFGRLSWAHLHNYYLQVFYEGGIFAFTAFLGVLIHTALRFDREKFSAAYMSFIAGLLATMLMWQTEAYGDLVKYGFVILSLMYNVPLLRQNEETAVVSRIHLVIRSPIKKSISHDVIESKI